MSRLHVGLCSYFHAADKAEGDPAITVDGSLAHRGHPEFGGKLLGGGLHLMQGEHERPNFLRLVLPKGTLGLEIFGLGLGGLVPLDQAVVFSSELILVLDVPGVFLDALLGHLCQQLHLLREGLQLRINGRLLSERTVPLKGRPRQTENIRVQAQKIVMQEEKTPYLVCSMVAKTVVIGALLW